MIIEQDNIVFYDVLYLVFECYSDGFFELIVYYDGIVLFIWVVFEDFF